jgi:predicted transposase/invertase (TIGR01784 family)
LVTPRDKWLFFLKNLESFDSIPSILREPIFEKAFHTAEFITYPPELQDAYINDRKVYWDNINVVATAEIEGKKKGRIEEKIEIDQKCKQLSMDIEVIAHITGLSINEIKKL